MDVIITDSNHYSKNKTYPSTHQLSIFSGQVISGGDAIVVRDNAPRPVRPPAFSGNVSPVRRSYARHAWRRDPWKISRNHYYHCYYHLWQSAAAQCSRMLIPGNFPGRGYKDCRRLLWTGTVARIVLAFFTNSNA